MAAMKYCSFHKFLQIGLKQKGYAAIPTKTEESMTLAEETAALAVKAGANATPERKAIYGKGQQHVEAAGILETALKVGDRAPMFELPGADGVMVKLADVLKSGPAVVSFYRGAWCPFCNLELRALQRELASAQAAGVTLVAISPNTPDTSAELVDENELTFPVLSDAENAVAKSFNLVFEMEEGLVEFYKAEGRNIDEMNGSEVWELPVPATYVIDTAGVIQYAYVDLNHRARAEPSEVIAVAAAL
ncbi:MAG: peroxiredoxin [Verrucomicrobiales bacterium]|jgi:peroxiredoxin